MSSEARKIDYALRRHEEGLYAPHSLEWCASRIDWAWKWRKITEEEKNEFCDRLIKLFEGNI